MCDGLKSALTIRKAIRQTASEVWLSCKLLYLDLQSHHLLPHHPPLRPIADKTRPGKPLKKRHRQVLLRQRALRRIPEQGVRRRRQMPCVHFTANPPVLQDDYAVGHPLQVGHTLGDIKDGHASAALGIDQFQQTLGVGVGQGGGGFIEDQQAGLQGEGAGQYQQLSISLSEAFDRQLQRQVQAQAGGDGFGALQEVFAVEQEIRAGQAQLVKQQVFRDAQARTAQQ